MRINASFPYITPVGEVKFTTPDGEQVVDQYADAGYYDNVGGTITIRIQSLFKKVLRLHFPELLTKIKIKKPGNCESTRGFLSEFSNAAFCAFSYIVQCSFLVIRRKQ